MKKLLLLLIPFILFTTCEKDNDISHANEPIVTHTIFVGNFYYDPPNITINQGEEIRWINDGGLHDVNGEINSLNNLPFNNPESFNSPSTSTIGAEIYRHKFNTHGFYNYDCSVGGHAINGMTGTITVIGID
tara:strand:+ start:2165 stop:2560 length:396 start_codon:yes stop_codon:yes gene_type:complete